MRTILRTTLLTAILLTGLSLSGEQISVGVRIGPPPPPRVLSVRPPTPGPGFTWIDGYWYPDGHRYRWHDGYWTRPPYDGAAWVMPRHDGTQFFDGYWEGSRGRIAHDHKWDRHHERDYNGRGHDEDRH